MHCCLMSVWPAVRSKRQISLTHSHTHTHSLSLAVQTSRPQTLSSLSIAAPRRRSPLGRTTIRTHTHSGARRDSQEERVRSSALCLQCRAVKRHDCPVSTAAPSLRSPGTASPSLASSFVREPGSPGARKAGFVVAARPGPTREVTGVLTTARSVLVRHCDSVERSPI